MLLQHPEYQELKSWNCWVFLNGFVLMVLLVDTSSSQRFSEYAELTNATPSACKPASSCKGLGRLWSQRDLCRLWCATPDQMTSQVHDMTAVGWCRSDLAASGILLIILKFVVLTRMLVKRSWLSAVCFLRAPLLHSLGSLPKDFPYGGRWCVLRSLWGRRQGRKLYDMTSTADRVW